jgi:hypothetical protein
VIRIIKLGFNELNAKLKNKSNFFATNYTQTRWGTYLKKIKMSDKDKKSRNDILLEMRDYAQEEFDKLIVYLNSGALILTIGFVKDITKITEETDTTLLIWSWSSFVCSLLLILLSHKTAILSTDFELKDKETISDRFDTATSLLNWISFIILMIGIILFITCITKNI